ncbi:MAG: SET domain-containing protein [Nanoarchaeota archaeon]|nr:SET domain-containing protein [Nanoarchaeota archaeon]
MLTIKTSLKEFKNKGIGLISEEFIKKGTVVWKFDPIIDIIVDEEKIPEEAVDFYDIYAVRIDENKLMLNTDNARFMNHSENPNIKSHGELEEDIAVEDINPGEEITINYKEIEEVPLNFENKEGGEGLRNKKLDKLNGEAVSV